MSLSQRPEGEPSTSTVTAASALDGLPVTAAARLGEVRLSAVVATTLRAALDLALGGGPPLRPLWVSIDDAVIEIRCALGQSDALGLAGGLLEAIEGSLTRAREERGEWIFRVPLAVARPTFLMLTQGTLGLAVPWHAVSRVRLVPSSEFQATARREDAELIPSFVRGADPAADCPVVLLGLGLKRALLVADRLIWRLPAEPIANAGHPRGPALTRAVGTPDGEVYWVVDLAELMRSVEVTALPPRTPVIPSAPAVAPITARAERQPEATPAAPPSPPAPSSSPAPTPAADPQRGSPDRSAAPTALVAEDSIIGRMFLARLLERRGYEVEMVTRASQLDDALTRGPWSMVMADVDLPDSTHAEHLRRLVASGTPCVVALVRDRDDEALALASGIRHSLRKPFEAETLDRLLQILESPRKES
jgi:CheY-like chemotaxis protein